MKFTYGANIANMPLSGMYLVNNESDVETVGTELLSGNYKAMLMGRHAPFGDLS